ncbi:MAG: hypothetical protein HRU03_04555 [Nanoarchaeales archaeon]|nr:hypothetical protein [Nanoarchaeales archaeon]
MAEFDFPKYNTLELINQRSDDLNLEFEGLCSRLTNSRMKVASRRYMGIIKKQDNLTLEIDALVDYRLKFKEGENKMFEVINNFMK